MISTKRFANKLRELEYDFKEQRHYQNVWRKKGGTHIVMVPRKNQVTDLWVEQTLRQCGCEKGEIQEFIKDCYA